MRILGIESSCDETSASVVEDGKHLLSVVTASSMDLHTAYGGVVPEIAARSHIEVIIPVIEQALLEAFPPEDDKNSNSNSQVPIAKSDPWDQIDAIAVTYGAGLGGSLLVGVMTARTLAIAKNKPLYAVNHVEAHIYANFLTEAAPQLLKSKEPQHHQKVLGRQRARSNEVPTAQKYQLPSSQPVFPMLGLIVSGNHSQLVVWRDHFDYTLLGQTHDDAIGEAFDKVAKILGLPYPGGPNISKAALDGNPLAYTFPKAKLATVSPELTALRSKEPQHHQKVLGRQRARSNEDTPAHSPLLTAQRNHSYDFSFSGIKTAVLRTAQGEIGKDHTFPSFQLQHHLTDQQKVDIAASFQRIAVETVVDKTIQAFEEFQPASVVIGGGVAASAELRRQLAERLPITPHYTDTKLCTDNGAMVATLGCFHMQKGQPTADPYTLDIKPNLSM